MCMVWERVTFWLCTGPCYLYPSCPFKENTKSLGFMCYTAIELYAMRSGKIVVRVFCNFRLIGKIYLRSYDGMSCVRIAYRAICAVWCAFVCCVSRDRSHMFVKIWCVISRHTNCIYLELTIYVVLVVRTHRRSKYWIRNAQMWPLQWMLCDFLQYSLRI